MTKEFNKQQRNDSRPSFRKPSPSRYGEERSPHPARPRLNRETVDRAWESGASQQHADYRPRSTNGQPPRTSNGWRSNRDNRDSRDGQQSEYRPQNSQPGNRPYGNRPDGYRDNRDNPRRFERSSNDAQGPRPRSFGPERRSFGDQRPVDRQGYRSYSDGQNGTNNTGPRPYNRNNGQFRGQSQGRRYPDQEGYQRTNFERDNREPRRFERENRDMRDTGPRRVEREDRSPRSRDSFEQSRNTYRDREDRPRPTQNPRWQTRPANRRPETQFEGDYEAFEDRQTRQPAERAPEQSFRGRPKRNDSEQFRTEEPHVTRLPDGRVLKGPRPVQRKNAEFWTGITQNTEELLDQIQVPAPAKEADSTGTIDAITGEEQPSPTDEVEAEALSEADGADGLQRKKKLYKPRVRTASATTRGKKSITAPKPRGNGPKPSHRGFKWPSPQHEES